ncbi:MAG: hypothetical protein H5U40_05060, partial [Polyangiaceae bacterium]|nr:hypothetical protein [Polyangiaceae bacterium]
DEYDEPTRLRSVASPPPPQPPSWPLVQTERSPATQRQRRGVVSTGLGAAVGLVAGVLGTWLAVSAHAASSDKRASSPAQSATVEPRFRPSATLIQDRQTTDSVPFGLARSWANAAPVEEREPYDFAVPEDTEEIVLRFRRARQPSATDVR